MNFFKRAVLSVKARKGKSILQIFVFTVICVFVLAGLSIQSAAEKSGELARKKLGADVTLQVDMEKVREQQQQVNEGGRSRFEAVPIPVESAEELTAYHEIIGYNFYSSTTGTASGFNPIENEAADTETEEPTADSSGRNMQGGGMAQGDVSLQGAAFTDSISEFVDQTSIIIEGEHLTAEDTGTNVTLIEQTLAEENGLKLGDTITVTNPRDDSLTIDLEIAGIYKTTSMGPEQAMNFTALIPYNKLYVPYTAASSLKGEGSENTIDSAIYYIDDPADMQSFIDTAKASSTIDFEMFKLDADDQLYQQMVGPIDNVAAFSKNIVYLVSIAGAVILGLIVMMSIRERKYEMGVLLSLGEKRWKLSGQFVTEILMVAVLSLGLATVTGNVIADQIGNQLLNQELASVDALNTPDSFRGRGMEGFGPGMQQMQTQPVETIEELNVTVTGNDLSRLSLIGLLIAIISALLPSLSVLRLQPKTILSRQD
ncbi:ABC transporter permease [Mesobacillus harenae]|uniref:ABC transporter permease n=1 Tax=Mesobacillus harenae TaxID=2213203 RepID=UPI001580026F|nr:ABC transporter permease [Mesobacillus harenae]